MPYSALKALHLPLYSNALEAQISMSLVFWVLELKENCLRQKLTLVGHRVRGGSP